MAGKAKRLSIPKSVRFEVFKRDSFTCQYCGSKAPDIILVVDHIEPVKHGGPGDILNLVTACKDCNQGKGARRLSDSSAVRAQQKQLADLNEKRLQLHMLVNWRSELRQLEAEKIAAIVDALGLKKEHFSFFSIEITKWARRYQMEEVLAAIEQARPRYGHDTVLFVKMVPRIMTVDRKCKDKPYLRSLFYIRGILRARIQGCLDWQALQMLENAYLAGESVEQLTAFVKEVHDWRSFQKTMEEIINSHVDSPESGYYADAEQEHAMRLEEERHRQYKEARELEKFTEAREREMSEEFAAEWSRTEGALRRNES